MALRLTELGSQEGLDKVPSQHRAHDSATQTDDVHMIILHPLPGREVVRDQACAGSRNFVGAHGRANAAAANRHSAFYLARRNSPGQRDNKVWIVVAWVQFEGAEFDNLMTCCSESSAQFLLQPKSAVIGGDSDAHTPSPLLLARKRIRQSIVCYRSHFLKPLPFSNRYPIAGCGSDPPIPRRDPRELCQPELERRPRAIGQASRLFASSHQPQHLAGAIENRIGQRHAPPSLVNSRERHICIFDLEDRVPRHERSRMAVGSKSQVNQIEHRRRTGNGPQSLRILLRMPLAGRAIPPASRGSAQGAKAHARAGSHAGA